MLPCSRPVVRRDNTNTGQTNDGIHAPRMNSPRSLEFAPPDVPLREDVRRLGALVGDMLAADAVKNGWAGVVVFGAVRDAAVLSSLDIGIKALGGHPMRSVKRGEGMVDTPVAFGGVVFVPGDMLYADEDGIAVLPAPDDEDDE